MFWVFEWWTALVLLCYLMWETCGPLTSQLHLVQIWHITVLFDNECNTEGLILPFGVPQRNKTFMPGARASGDTEVQTQVLLIGVSSTWGTLLTSPAFVSLDMHNIYNLYLVWVWRDSSEWKSQRAHEMTGNSTYASYTAPAAGHGSLSSECLL